MNISGNYNTLFGKKDGEYLSQIDVFSCPEDPYYAHMERETKDEATIYDYEYLRENHNLLLIKNLVCGDIGNQYWIPKYMPQRFPDESVSSYQKRTSKLPIDVKYLSSSSTLGAIFSEQVRKAISLGLWKPEFGGNITEDELNVYGGPFTDYLTFLNNWITCQIEYGITYVRTCPAIKDKEDKIIKSPYVENINPLQVTFNNSNPTDGTEPFIQYWERKTRLVPTKTKSGNMVKAPQLYTQWKRLYSNRYITYYYEKNKINGEMELKNTGDQLYLKGSPEWHFRDEYGLPTPPMIRCGNQELYSQAKSLAHLALQIMVERGELSYMAGKLGTSKINVNISPVQDINETIIKDVRALAMSDSDASINAQYINPSEGAVRVKQEYVQWLEKEFARATGLSDDSNTGAKTATEIIKTSQRQMVARLSNAKEVISPAFQKLTHLHSQSIKPNANAKVNVRMGFSLAEVMEEDQERKMRTHMSYKTEQGNINRRNKEKQNG